MNKSPYSETTPGTTATPQWPALLYITNYYAIITKRLSGTIFWNSHDIWEGDKNS